MGHADLQAINPIGTKSALNLPYGYKAVIVSRHLSQPVGLRPAKSCWKLVDIPSDFKIDLEW